MQNEMFYVYKTTDRGYLSLVLGLLQIFVLKTELEHNLVELYGGYQVLNGAYDQKCIFL